MPKNPADVGDVVAVTLVDIAKGALLERFHEDQQKILANIHDVNTPIKKARKLRYEFTYLPTGGRTGTDRGEIALNIDAKVSLVEDHGISTLIHSGRVGASKEIHAVEYDPRQMEIFQPAPQPVAEPTEKESE